MEDYYEVFNEFGLSPATPEEWENCRTTHDSVWMAQVTTTFTERLMRDYLENHKNPEVLSKKMDSFIEFLRIQTGLSTDDTAHHAMLGTLIMEDRRFADDPEGARAAKREIIEEMQASRDDNDEVDPEIARMAGEFTKMIMDKREQRKRESEELKRIEYNMASEEIEAAMNELSELIKDQLGQNNIIGGDSIDAPSSSNKSEDTALSELEKMLNEIFKSDNN